jgi:hypothetical protein
MVRLVPSGRSVMNVTESYNSYIFEIAAQLADLDQGRARLDA